MRALYARDGRSNLVIEARPLAAALIRVEFASKGGMGLDAIAVLFFRLGGKAPLYWLLFVSARRWLKSSRAAISAIPRRKGPPKATMSAPGEPA